MEKYEIQNETLQDQYAYTTGPQARISVKEQSTLPWQIHKPLGPWAHVLAHSKQKKKLGRAHLP